MHPHAAFTPFCFLPQLTLESMGSSGAMKKSNMGIPGNLYVTTTCVAFMPLDGSLMKTSTAIIMYGDMEHHTGDYVRMIEGDPKAKDEAAMLDSVEIFDRGGKKMVLSDFLSRWVWFVLLESNWRD